MRYFIQTDVNNKLHRVDKNIRHLQSGDILYFNGDKYNVGWKVLDLSTNEFIVAVLSSNLNRDEE